MDAKITMSFNEQVIAQAKAYAKENNLSLSRLTEFLLSKVVSGTYKTIDELPVSDWVAMVAEGEAEYVRKPAKKSIKREFYERKGKK